MEAYMTKQESIRSRNDQADNDKEKRAFSLAARSESRVWRFRSV
jgi:hypothetical protein